MKKIIFLMSLYQVLASVSYGQVGRTQVTVPYYNGYSQVPGMSFYRGGYSIDYFGGSKSFRYGYVPPSRHPRRHYNAGNGIVMPRSYRTLPYAEWMFYYEGNYMTPYNINSPIWGW